MITYKVVKQTLFWTSSILRSARVNQGIGHSLCGRCHVRTFSSQKELAFALARFGARFLGQGVSFVYRSGLSKTIPLKSLLIGLATPVVAGGAYFLAHSERVPYSNRLHFTWLNEKDELNLSEQNRVLILQQERHHLVCPNAGIYKVTWRIVNDMLDVCEQDGIITQRRRERFSLNIIESKIPNAFVLPDGSIFLYTGLLTIAETEAGLACVLGHEISHSLARHSSEKIGIIKALILVFEFIRGLSDHERSLSATFIEFLAATVFQIGIPFAHSRAMEQEADCIGMKLAAKAGYDPAQAAAVWERMIAYEEKPKMKKQEKKEEGQGWVNSLVSAWVGAGKRQEHTQSTPIEQSNTAAASVRASPVSSATSTQEMTTRDRVKELLSTHPCHARRVEDLQAYVGQVREDFNQKIDSLTMSGRPVPESMRLLPYEGVRKPEDANRYGDYDYGWGDRDWESALLAQQCSALMSGTQGQEIGDFLKRVGRLHVAWGGGHGHGSR